MTKIYKNNFERALDHCGECPDCGSMCIPCFSFCLRKIKIIAYIWEEIPDWCPLADSETADKEWCPQHGYTLPCVKCGLGEYERGKRDGVRGRDGDDANSYLRGVQDGYKKGLDDVKKGKVPKGMFNKNDK